MLNFIWLCIVGAIMGVAHVIPGVSGGTFAVIFNVYGQIIAIITPNLKKLFAAWKFWLPMIIGTIVAILGFAKAFTYLYEHYQAPTMCFFTGIIVGSLPLMYRRSCTHSSNIPPFSGILCTVLAFGIMLVMAFANPASGDTLIPRLSFSLRLAAFLFGVGVLAAVAMMLPGISGSFILLIFGVYQSTMFAVDLIMKILINQLSRSSQVSIGTIIDQLTTPVLYLVPIVLGVIFGTFCGAALVRVLLKHLPLQTYSVILGLIAGSILIVFPALGTFYSMQIIGISIGTFIAGTAISYFFSLIEKRKNIGS